MQLDEEAAAIEEMQQAFKKEANNPDTIQEGESKGENKDEEGRRPWQYVKIKVPTYQWELEEGEVKISLKAGTMPAHLKEEQQSWWYDLASGGRNRIRIDFPLHLWGEIGNWWSKLKWGQRRAGMLKGVTWLELLVDFEIASGINCKKQQDEANWGARAELLRGIVKLIIKVRGTGGTMEKIRHLPEDNCTGTLRGNIFEWAPAKTDFCGRGGHNQCGGGQGLAMGGRR